MIHYYIYILRCRDSSLYTGWTNDVEKRVAQHNIGKGAKYTRSRLPATLVYCESSSSQGKAMRREREIKGLSREEKLDLVTKSKSSYIIVKSGRLKKRQLVS